MEIKQGDKFICKKSINIADNALGDYVGSKFIMCLMRVVYKDHYTKGKSYEVIEVINNPITKEIYLVRFEPNKVDQYDPEIFILDSIGTEDSKKLKDYFFIDKKEIRKRKLDKLNN